jgi:rubrerythrin
MPTLENLQAAFNGESNARAKYLTFAAKADEEGYAPVASLFRAAAAAEGIHAESHARVIKKMGATPVANIAKVEVHSTRENLVVAIEGETYERDVMYPEFIKQAKAEENQAAVRTCEYALAAEAEHAKLYQEAHDNLEQWRGGKRTFYVCPVCGYTTATPVAERCPVCNAHKDKFKAID